MEPTSPVPSVPITDFASQFIKDNCFLRYSDNGELIAKEKANMSFWEWVSLHILRHFEVGCCKIKEQDRVMLLAPAIWPVKKEIETKITKAFKETMQHKPAAPTGNSPQGINSQHSTQEDQRSKGLASPSPAPAPAATAQPSAPAVPAHTQPLLPAQEAAVQPETRKIFKTESSPSDAVSTTQLDLTQRATLGEEVPAGIPKDQEAQKKNSLREKKQRVRAKVFEITQEVCGLKYYIVDGKKISWEQGAVDEMVQGTTFYPSVDLIPEKARRKYQTEFNVENADSFDVAKDLSAREMKPAVLNMANGKHAGGGVFQGSGAQEESLFRCSNLFQSLTDLKLSSYEKDPKTQHGHYVYKEEVSASLGLGVGVIVSPHVLVFREAEGESFDFREDPFSADVISCAAFARTISEFKAPTQKDANGKDLMQTISWGNKWIFQIPVIDEDAFKEGMKEKVRNVLRAAYKNGNDSVILGALGCGAFDFNGITTTMMIKEILPEIFNEDEFKGVFKNVTLAVLDRGGKMGLYDRFKPLENTLGQASFP